MDTAAYILVIINSVFLALFLLLAIVATVAVIKLVKQIRLAVDKAEDVIETAEEVADAFKNVGGPLAALKLVKNIVELVNKHSNKKK